jgi:hypothetical protein
MEGVQMLSLGRYGVSVEQLAEALAGYISVPELAKRLGVTKERARQLVQAGEVQALHCPLGWLVEPESAQALVERRAALQRPRPWSSLSW